MNWNGQVHKLKKSETDASDFLNTLKIKPKI